MSPEGAASVGAPVEFDWEAIARAHAHPIRVSIMDLLAIDGGRILSSTEMAFELRTRLPNVHYHVVVLAKLGFIYKVKSRRVRGVRENFYVLLPHAIRDGRVLDPERPDVLEADGPS